ncbi:hypothetical protein STEG23_004663 [Scotinomys teguina]
MWFIYTMEYYAAEKNNDIMKFAGKWMDLENVILSEAQNQGYELLAHPNIHQTDELLEHEKGTNLQIQNTKISMTWDINRISQKNPSDSQLSVVWQKPEALSQTNDMRQ